MAKQMISAVVMLAVVSVAGCDQDKETVEAPTPTTTVSAAKPTTTTTVVESAPPDEEIPRMRSYPTDDASHDMSVRYLLDRFIKPRANHAAISKLLIPKDDDYAAAFEDAAAAVAKTRYQAQFKSEPLLVKPKRGQTKYLFWGATTEELRTGKGKADKFPGGYKKIAHKLKPGLTFYCFKFVEPDKTVGTSYDGLVFVNGHWVMFPKPYAVLR